MGLQLIVEGDPFLPWVLVDLHAGPQQLGLLRREASLDAQRHGPAEAEMCITHRQDFETDGCKMTDLWQSTMHCQESHSAVGICAREGVRPACCISRA